MTTFFRVYIYLFFIILHFNNCLAQDIEIVGHPFIEKFYPEDYGAAEQNWAVLQNKEGLMLFGNNDGLLSFNGTNWKLHRLTGKTIRSLAMNKEGRVFVGSVGDFGYLTYSENGSLLYHSLLEELPENARAFDDVWQTHVTSEGVFFHTNVALYKYHDGKIEVILPTEGKFHFSFKVRDEIYVREWGKGFFKVNNGKLAFLEGSERYAQERVYAVLPFQKNKILFVGRDTGMNVYEKGVFTAFGSQSINDKIRKSIYHGAALKENYFAFVAGVALFILDEKGNVVHEINSKDDLGVRNPLHVYLDKQDNLWTGNYGNITRIELFSPFSYLSKKENIPNRLLSVGENDNYLYAGLTEGLFYKLKNTRNPFTRINFTEVGNGDQIWSTIKYNNHLLMGSGLFLISVENDTSFQILKDNMFNVIDLIQLSTNENEFLGANMNGIFHLKYENDEWKYESTISNIDFSLNQIIEFPSGVFWTASNESYKLRQFKLDLESNLALEITPFGVKEGLPEEENNVLVNYKNELLACTSKGIYHYSIVDNKFQPYEPFQDILGEIPIRLMVEDNQNNLWYLTRNLQVGKIVKGKDGFKNIITPYKKFSNKGIDSYSPHMSAFENGLLLGVNEGAIYFNEEKLNIEKPSYKSIISQIRIGSDSVFYAGFGELDSSKPINLSIINNNIQFSYNAIFFEDREHLQYSYQLEGNEEEWSPWTTANIKEYTNLWEGNYTFKVKAKNIYDQESEVAKFKFKVFPPFYRTWWAYMIYILFLLLVIYGIAKWNTRRLSKENEKLESLIDERTKELKENQQVLQVKQEEILTQNEELRQKQEELQAQRDFIEARNTELKFKNRQIEKSIESAELIQKAVLPSANKLKDYFLDYFLLFKPRDIVSGDFYWVSKKDDAIWIAVADCTGHGVPGAFMTLLGKNIFDNLINDSRVDTPAEMLKYLDEEIRILLQQDDTEITHHGMDLVMLKIEYITTQDKLVKIHYAGAKNPLYLYEPKKDELQEYKADKLLIAGIIKKSKAIEFTNHTFEVETGTTLYLCTDGYHDQNNVKRKSFSRLKFKDLLAGIMDKPLVEQQTVLEETLSEHMYGTEQRDDILVMGVKV